MKDTEDMKALALLCEEVGNDKFKQIRLIRDLMGLSLAKASEVWIQLSLSGMIKA